MPGDPAPGSTTTATSKLAPHVAHLVSGSGQWRAPNPDYRPGGDAPRQYGMNYRYVMIDPNTRVANVYARDEQGGWKKVLPS